MGFFEGFADELLKVAQNERHGPVKKGLMSKNPTSEKPKTLKGGHTYRNTGDHIDRKIPTEGISRTVRGLSHKAKNGSIFVTAPKKYPGPHPLLRKYVPGIAKGWR